MKRTHSILTLMLLTLLCCRSYAQSGDKWNIQLFGQSAHSQLQENILPFWLAHSVDTRHGGFYGRITTDGTGIEDAPKGLVLNTRILWTFSAAYMYDSKPAYLKAARRAYDYFVENFEDKQYGGAYWLLDHTGKPTDDSKELYGQSFALYALTEYYRATGFGPAIEKAQQLYEIIEKKCHDSKDKGYFETFSRDWTPAAKARLAHTEGSETKTMNTHLHMLEAYTNLYRVWRNDRLRNSLKELIEIFRDHIIDHETYHFKLFFDDKWNSMSDIVSFGHDIEGSWLLCEAVEVLGDEGLAGEIEDIAIKMAQAVYKEGLDADGGLFYEAEKGKISKPEKVWWAEAEAVVGFLNAYQLTAQKHYLDAAYNCWQFTLDNIVDKKHGEWFGQATEGKRPADTAGKTSEWKAPYHNSRACLEIISRTGKLQPIE